MKKRYIIVTFAVVVLLIILFLISKYKYFHLVYSINEDKEQIEMALFDYMNVFSEFPKNNKDFVVFTNNLKKHYALKNKDFLNYNYGYSIDSLNNYILYSLGLDSKNNNNPVNGFSYIVNGFDKDLIIIKTRNQEVSCLEGVTGSSFRLIKNGEYVDKEGVEKFRKYLRLFTVNRDNVSVDKSPLNGEKYLITFRYKDGVFKICNEPDGYSNEIKQILYDLISYFRPIDLDFVDYATFSISYNPVKA